MTKKQSKEWVRCPSCGEAQHIGIYGLHVGACVSCKAMEANMRANLESYSQKKK